MRTHTIRGATRARRFAPILFTAALLAPLVGCDSNGADDEVEIRGRVTDDATSGFGPIDGAVVVASEVDGDGDVTAMNGQATTDADGEFSLTTDGTTEVVLLTATDGAFRSRALLERGAAASGTISAPTLTAETDAEAAVYLAAARSNRIRVSDVAFYVTREVAGRIGGGAATANDVAIALEAAINAEAAYAADRGASGDLADAAEIRDDAYGDFRTAIFASSTTTAGQAARLAFEKVYAGALTAAGASADVQAGAGLAASRAAERFSGSIHAGTAFEVQRQARLYAAQAAALAIEESFRLNGGSTRLTALAMAREALVAGVASALTEEAVALAETQFRAVVRAELVGETGVTDVELQAGESSTASARAALEAAVSAAATADAVGEAVATFQEAARAAVTASLGSVDALAIDVITYTSLIIAAG